VKASRAFNDPTYRVRPDKATQIPDGINEGNSRRSGVSREELIGQRPGRSRETTNARDHETPKRFRNQNRRRDAHR